MNSDIVTWDDAIYYHFEDSKYHVPTERQSGWIFVPVKDWDVDCLYTLDDGEPIDG